MAIEVKLPKLGRTMEEGIIIKCSVNVGDEVGRGDTLFEIETDKATMEMESPDKGFVKAILVEAGQTIPIHQTILILGDEDEQIPQELIESAKIKNEKQTNDADPPIVAEMELSSQEIAEAVSDSPAKEQYHLGEVVPLNRFQKITAQRMLQSKREIPCFYLTVRANMTATAEYRQKINADCDVKVSYNDFIIKAIAIGLERFGTMAGRLEGETIKLAENINVGLAISVPGGVVAPVVKEANKKDIRQIAKDSQALAERARNNKLSPDDLEGGCITISNLGSFGIEWFIPIVIPGQCSILGIGAIIDTPTPDTGDLQISRLMNMTLSVDHRIANGAYAGQFLDYVRKVIEEPASFK